MLLLLYVLSLYTWSWKKEENQSAAFTRMIIIEIEKWPTLDGSNFDYEMDLACCPSLQFDGALLIDW